MENNRGRFKRESSAHLGGSELKLQEKKRRQVISVRRGNF